MALEGIALAPDDGALVANPVWERIDTVYNVRSWTVDRGRPNEMSKTETGAASVELVDRTGDFDPTNPAGAFYGRLEPGYPLGPGVQAGIGLQNPGTGIWSTVFRGHVASVQWVPYRREDHANVTLDLADGLALLGATEMAPDGSFGDSIRDGNIIFDEINATNAVETRIHQVLDQAGWPTALRRIFSGNVKLQESVYSPRSPVLNVIQDAADAEFPTVANVYIGGPKEAGWVVFHGRYARFHPEVAQYNIRTWKCGDDQAAAADSQLVRVSPPLGANLDDTLLYTSALALPSNVHDGDIANQYLTDSVAAGQMGLRTWSAENLLTLGGDNSRTALAETRLMSAYIRDNFARPQVRVGQLTVKSRSLTSLNGQATWNLLTDIDISDIVHLTTTHSGGGGFDHDFYVEGIHYAARPGGGRPYVELTLDVSPKAYYDANPFEDLLAWNQVPTGPAYQWNTINQTVPWNEALMLDDLTA
jgi:hypothetical protein